jgi:hypothetical protein
MDANDHTPDQATDQATEPRPTAPGAVTDATVAADERDATEAHRADRAPTPDEEARADQLPEVPAESAAAYREAMERGANVRGEGRIDR